MSKRVNPNSYPLAKSDKFVVQTAIELTDSGVAGVKLTDVTLNHNVDKNGQEFVDCSCTWYGLEDHGVAAIQDSLAKGGLVAGSVSVTGFQALVNEWRKITAALGHLNVAGDNAVKTLGL